MPGISVPRIAIPFQNQNVVFLSVIPQVWDVTNGFLYNWYAVDNAKGLAPTGWHIPTYEEWNTLVSYVDDSWDLIYVENIGAPMKETGAVYWNTANGTNTTGFTARGAGYRDEGDAQFYDIKADAQWWYRYLVSGNYYVLSLNDSLTLYRRGVGIQHGASVRVIRDTNVGWVAGELITDYDGNSYNTVQIGTQIWSMQNLAVTHYRDGTSIPEIIDDLEWVMAEAHGYCAYNNDWSYAGSFVVSTVPSNALLNDDGTPVINDDGSYIITSD